MFYFLLQIWLVISKVKLQFEDFIDSYTCISKFFSFTSNIYDKLLIIIYTMNIDRLLLNRINKHDTSICLSYLLDLNCGIV